MDADYYYKGIEALIETIGVYIEGKIRAPQPSPMPIATPILEDWLWENGHHPHIFEG